MNKPQIISVLVFVAFYIASRFLAAKALEALPDDKKLHLINVSSQGRKYLLFWATPLILVFIFKSEWFFLVLIALLVFMVIYNHIWVRCNQFPSGYVTKHLISTLLILISFPTALGIYYVTRNHLL